MSNASRTPPTQPTSAPIRPHRLSWRKKCVFGLLTTCALLATAEFSLRMLGVSAPETVDPWVGFSKNAPLLTAATAKDGTPMLKVADHKLVWFNEQSFPKTKAAGVKRVFSLGGSTTYGRPYSDSTSYTGWLRELLRESDPDTTWEVINVGGVSYASYRVVRVMEELAQYEPDLFIVYSAHNEFLERRTYAGLLDESRLQAISQTLGRTRLWTTLQRATRQIRGVNEQSAEGAGRTLLDAEVNEALNHTVGPVDYHRDAEWTRGVIRHYRWNLERMREIAAGAGAPLLVILPACNESHCSPFKSEFSETSTAEQRTAWNQHLDEASKAFNRSPPDFAASLHQLDQAITIDPKHALAHYQRGRVLTAMGKFSEAEAAFQTAIEEDVCPLRATSAIRSALVEFVARHQAPHVDFQQRLKDFVEEQKGRRVLGDAEFLDHVHPTIAAHGELARWLHDEMAAAGLAPSHDAEHWAAVAERVPRSITKIEQGVSRRNLAKVLHWAGKFEEAEPHARDALKHLPDDAESWFLMAECQRQTGSSKQAYETFDELLTLHPGYQRAYVPFASLMYDRGELKPAMDLVKLALETWPDDAYANYWLGVLRLELGEADPSAPLLKALRQYPDDPGTLYVLARAKTEEEQWLSAEKYFRRVLEVQPDHALSHNGLGWVLLQMGQKDQAIEHFQRALEINPSLIEAQQNLDLTAPQSEALK